ncbi:hypothetical protein LMIY3S_01598 [Labrys miyagiensis]
MPLREVADAGGAVGKVRDDCTAGAVRQGMKNTIKVSHMAK